MKKSNMLIVAGLSSLLIATFVFTSNKEILPLQAMSNQAGYVVETTGKFVSTPLQESNLQFEVDDEVRNQVMEIIAYRQTIRQMQQDINELVPQLKEDIANIRELINAFKQAGLRLSEDERLQMVTLRNEFVELRTQVRATRGQVYELIKELKGQYTIENIDLIYETYLVAYENMLIRHHALLTFNDMIIEVKDFLTLKVG